MIGAAVRLASRTVPYPGNAMVRIGITLDYSHQDTGPVALEFGTGWLYHGSILVDWGDGSPVVDGVVGHVEHPYQSSGDFEVTVVGPFRRFGPSEAGEHLLTFNSPDHNHYMSMQYVRVEDDTADGLVSFGGFSLNGLAPSETGFEVPARVSELLPYAFSGQSMVKSVALPSTLTAIGASAFRGCSQLHGVDLPSRVTTIGRGAFEDCASLQVLDVPASVRSLGDWAFAGCALHTVHLSEGLSSIGANTFRGWSRLGSLYVPSTCASVGSEFLYGTSLGHGYGTLTLRSRQVVPYVEPFGPEFEGWLSSRVLYVPPDLVDAYVLAGWGSRFHVVEIPQS